MLQRLGTQVWDKLGIGLSAVCLAHCVLLPLAVSFLPFLGLKGFHHEATHGLLLTVALPVGILALVPGYLKHGTLWIPLLGTLSLALLLGGTWAHSLGIEGVEGLLGLLGALGLLTSHLSNWSLCTTRCDKKCHSH